MKKTGKITLFVLCILLAAVNCLTAAADGLTCYDANGKPYPASAPDRSICYQYSGTAWIPNGLTKGQVSIMQLVTGNQEGYIPQVDSGVKPQPTDVPKQDTTVRQPETSLLPFMNIEYDPSVKQPEKGDQQDEYYGEQNPIVVSNTYPLIPEEEQYPEDRSPKDTNKQPVTDTEGYRFPVGTPAPVDVVITSPDNGYDRDFENYGITEQDPVTDLEGFRIFDQDPAEVGDNYTNPDQSPVMDFEGFRIFDQDPVEVEEIYSDPNQIPVTDVEGYYDPVEVEVIIATPYFNGEKDFEGFDDPDADQTPVDQVYQDPDYDPIKDMEGFWMPKQDVYETPEADLSDGTVKISPTSSSTGETKDDPAGIHIPEGTLDQLVQVSPNGDVLTKPSVTFRWTYTITKNSRPVDVEFNLLILVMDLMTGQYKTITETIPSARCKNQTCSYTAGNEFAGMKKATGSWTVTATYMKGFMPVTVTAQNAGLPFTIDVNGPVPTPVITVTPTVRPKPGVPDPQYPSGRVTSRSLGFYWLPAPNADYYTVDWMDEKGHMGSMNLSNNDATCRLGLCIAYTTLPGTGRYAWVVTALNSSGASRSREMFFEIANNIPAPTPYRPRGTVYNHTYPAFEWEDVQNGATEYHLQVIGKSDNRIRLDHWYNVRDIYVGKGVCYVQSSVFLPAGSYSWRVQARNSEQTSGWSFWCDFTVECTYCNSGNTYYNNYTNTVPTCSYPIGTITANTPDFQWRTLTGAAYYMVTLYNASGTVLFENQVSNTNCTAELCTYSPKYKLPKNGNYSWSVSGYGANGSRWGSANASFTLNAPVTLKPITFLRPTQNGLLTADAPVIIWSDPGETTVLFHIEIFNSSSKQLFSADLNREQAWCDGQSCSIEFKTIPDAENYRMTITPYSELNTAGETVSLVFSKGGIPIKLNSPKENAVVSSRPLFRWNLDAGADAKYELILTDAGNNSITFKPLVCGAVGVTCEGNEAFFSPADPIASGSYTAKITTPESGYSGEEVHFTVR